MTSPIVLGNMVEETPVVDGAYVVEAAMNPDNEGDVVTIKVEIPAYPFPYFRG